MSQKFFKTCLNLLAMLALLAACVPGGKAATPEEAATHAAVHWTYEGEEGPSSWGELSPDYETCGTGNAQSPVNIPAAAPKGISNLTFHYQASKINIVNNGHTVQVNYDSGSYIELDKVRYDLVQFHFHAPSEHSFNGKLADAELHLVHKSSDGQLAVVGVMLVEGAENPAFETTWEYLPFTKSLLRTNSAKVDALGMLPADRSMYQYTGSLTTPPCTEGVKWNVLATPVELSQTQLFVFRNIFEGNNRPVQALNSRAFRSDFAPSATPTALPTPTATPAPAHWTYEGEEGPANWGQLSPEYATCSAGQAQSPIDLTKAALKDLPNLVFNYQPSKINILNNGHTIQVNYDEGSYIELDGLRYDLVQFHFHAPSEHTIDGRLFDAELHLVHKSADGQLAVVGVLLVQGAENPAFTTTWENLPAEKSDVQELSATVDAAALLPKNQAVYRYSGSLTTPPCTEGVQWSMMSNLVQISAKQLAAFTAIFEGNNRPVQPLNERPLLKDSTP